MHYFSGILARKATRRHRLPSAHRCLPAPLRTTQPPPPLPKRPYGFFINPSQSRFARQLPPRGAKGIALFFRHFCLSGDMRTHRFPRRLCLRGKRRSDGALQTSGFQAWRRSSAVRDDERRGAGPLVGKIPRQKTHPTFRRVGLINLAGRFRPTHPFLFRF